jgi:hypothetical protein
MLKLGSLRANGRVGDCACGFVVVVLKVGNNYRGILVVGCEVLPRAGLASQSNRRTSVDVSISLVHTTPQAIFNTSKRVAICIISGKVHATLKQSKLHANLP